MSNVLFGPAGNSASFYNEGHKTTMEAPKWLKEKGLDLFEYSFGEGYRMTSETAQKIGDEFKKYGIELSLHAPYFINFANVDDVMYQKSLGYILTGIKFMKLMNANRLIFHSGSQMKLDRSYAIELIDKRYREIMPKLEEELDGLYLCPETMGKHMQIGTYEEIIDLCTISDRLLPTFDFGHINAYTGGKMNSEDEFRRVFEYSIDKLGFERTKKAHIHFSKIEYGAKGEIRHLTFADTIYGPEFDNLAKVLVDLNLDCHIISESAGTQCEDSLIMQDIYRKTLAKK